MAWKRAFDSRHMSKKGTALLASRSPYYATTVIHKDSINHPQQSVVTTSSMGTFCLESRAGFGPVSLLFFLEAMWVCVKIGDPLHGDVPFGLRAQISYLGKFALPPPSYKLLAS